MTKICETCAFEHDAELCPRCEARKARTATPVAAPEAGTPEPGALAPDADKLGLEQANIMGGSPEPGAEPAAPESVTADPEPTAEAEVEEALPLPEPIAPPPEIEDAVAAATARSVDECGLPDGG